MNKGWLYYSGVEGIAEDIGRTVLREVRGNFWPIPCALVEGIIQGIICIFP